MNVKKLRKEDIDNFILDDLKARISNWESIQSYMQENDDEVTRLELKLEEELSAEKRRSIQDGIDKLKEAREYVNEQIMDLKEQAATDATSKADQALEDSKTYVDDILDTINVPEGGLTPGDIKKIKVDSARDADTVSGFTVAKDIPADAIFTDTTYKAGKGIIIGDQNEVNVDLEDLIVIKTSDTEPELTTGGQWHREEVL